MSGPTRISTRRRQRFARLSLLAAGWFAACRSATVPVSPEPAASAHAPARDDDAHRWRGFSRERLENALRGEGLEGWVHGARADLQQWVFTVRDADDFFRFLDFAIIPATPDVATHLASLGRHDRIRVRGEIETYGQLHLRVTAVERVEAYEGHAAYAQRFEATRDLPQEGRVTGRVHAVDAKGAVLVLEVHDAVIPVRVPAASVYRLGSLARGDLVEMAVRQASHPTQPLHLELLGEEHDAISVLEAVREGHGEAVVVEGPLVRFPQSPQIKFDVFAVQVAGEVGPPLNYTLVNFEDPATFRAMRERLSAVWEANADSAVPGRNRWVNPSLRIRAQGTKNVIDPNQANPQILIDAVEAIEIERVDGI